MSESTPNQNDVLQPVASTGVITTDNDITEQLRSPEAAFADPPPDAPVIIPATSHIPVPAPAQRARAPIQRKNILEVEGSELTAAVKEIRKQNGPTSVVTGDRLPSFNQIPTGVFVLDYSLLGGIHTGLAHQFYGWENVGKTSMLLRIMRNYQIRFPDRAIVFAPLEGTFDPEHARVFGVDLEKVVILRSASTESLIDEIMALYVCKEVCAVFLDSIPAMVPKEIIEKSAEDKTMAQAARLATVLFQKMNVALWNERRRDHLVSFFATNQWRMNPGKMFGDPRYLPGGNHQKFFFTNFIEIKSKEAKGHDQVGQQVLAQLDQAFHIDKAKVGACVIDGEFQTVVSPNHPSGLPVGAIDEAASIATIAKKHGFISGGGGHWRVAGVEKVAQECRKLEDIVAFLHSHPLEALALKQRIIADLRISRNRPAFPPDGYLLNSLKVYKD